MAGEGSHHLGHFHIEEERGRFGEGEVDGGRNFLEGLAVAGLQVVDYFLLVVRELGRFFHSVQRQLLSQQGPAKLEGYVVGVADKECAVGSQEVDGAARVGVGEAAGDGEDVAVVAGGNGGGDEGAAFIGGFDDDGGVGQGGDDAVACREVARVDGGAVGVFGDEGAAGGQYLFGQIAVLGRIDAVQSVAEDGDGGQPVGEGGGVGSGVDAVGKSADYRCVVGFQFVNEAVGVVDAVGGGAAGADDGHRTFGVEVGVAHDIEQCGTVVGLGAVETLGVVGRGEEEGSDMVLLAEAQFLLGTRESALVQNIV